MKCPICDSTLKKKSNIKEGEEFPSVVEITEKCTNCKIYKYELLGPSMTTWLNNNEYYSLTNIDNYLPYRRMLIWLKFKYKVSVRYKTLKKIVLKIANRIKKIIKQIKKLFTKIKKLTKKP